MRALSKSGKKFPPCRICKILVLYCEWSVGFGRFSPIVLLGGEKQEVGTFYSCQGTDYTAL